MKLAIATPEYPPHAGGGIAKYYATLAAALVRCGCTVDVIVSAPFSDELRRYEHDGVRVHGVPRAAIDRRAADLSHLSAAPRFRRWLAAAQAAHDVVADMAVDAIEVIDFGLAFVPFVSVPLAAPTLVQCHGSLGQISVREPLRPDLALDHALTRITEAVLLGDADAVMTYGSSNAKDWSTRLNRAVTVEPPPLGPAARRARDQKGALVVGRIQTWKGPETLARALYDVPETRLPRIEWVGRDTDTAPDGGSLDAWLTRTYPEVWGDRIAAVGSRPPDAVLDMMRRVQMVIVPSGWDVFNFTAVEGMAAGCVVVCSDGAGASDVIQNGENGFTFPAGDFKTLAQVLITASSLSAGEARRLGDAARETVVNALNPDRIARRRLTHYAAAAVLPRRRTIPDWTRAFVTGQESAPGLSFLDQFSLRDLTAYTARRAGRRALARMRSTIR